MTTGPRYRGLRLDGPTEEFHQAVDWLRWDTTPAPLDHQPQAHQGRTVTAATPATGRWPL